MTLRQGLQALWLALLPGLALASLDAEQLRQAVGDYLDQQRQSLLAPYGPEARLDYRISRLDPRLRLAGCDEPLSLDVNSLTNSGRLNVLVRCSGTSPWSLYVPVELSVWQPVVVAAAPVARGQVLTASALEVVEHDVRRMHRSYWQRPEELVGHVARRVIPAGSPITASQVEAPHAVRRGSSVIIEASQGGLLVKMAGTAQQDGRLGDRIAVRNSQSRRLLEARVIGPDRVRVIL